MGIQLFYKNHCYPNEQYLKNKLRQNVNISLSAIFFYLSKPIGDAFFSIAYIQHTSAL